jgi:predicted ATPase
LLRRGGPDDAREAERHFLESLDWARRQHTLAWELRTSISLGTLWRNQSRLDDARKLVRSSYVRFEEGLETADPRTAEKFLMELG